MFDTEQFIKLIKERPCLWKYSSPQYHDKDQKRRAYEEVAEIIFDDWDTLSEGNKTEKLIVLEKKWKNVRDCFRRELTHERRGVDRKRKRRYIHTDLLEFLRGQQYEEKHNDKGSIDCKQEDLYESDDCTDEKPLSTFVRRHNKKPKVSESSSYTPTITTTTSKRNSDYLSLLQHQDQDMAFFQSILSNVHKLNDQQRIQFRLDVLNALKKF